MASFCYEKKENGSENGNNKWMKRKTEFKTEKRNEMKSKCVYGFLFFYFCSSYVGKRHRQINRIK